jgi:hypothetical protein
VTFPLRVSARSWTSSPRDWFPRRRTRAAGKAPPWRTDHDAAVMTVLMLVAGVATLGNGIIGP